MSRCIFPLRSPKEIWLARETRRVPGFSSSLAKGLVLRLVPSVISLVVSVINLVMSVNSRVVSVINLVMSIIN